MSVTILVAASDNGVIGANNKLPWHLPADLKRFKELTMGHPIIMGRKTFESIGKPLPGRTNIVVTRQKEFQACGCMTVHSLEDALLYCEDAQEAFIVGGAEIYRQALPFADRIYLTRVHRNFDGDTFLFDLDPATWKETSRQDFPADSKNPNPYSFLILLRV